MYELEKNEEVIELISKTKSNSGISGPELVKAHIRLGELIAKKIDADPYNTTVVSVLRGGIFFAQGIYFGLGCKFDVFNPRSDIFKWDEKEHIILVDSVINTGETLLKYLRPNVEVACCVINEKAVPKFKNINLYTVRVSKNSFVGSDIREQSGSKGPDTTMRLFNQL